MNKSRNFSRILVLTIVSSIIFLSCEEVLFESDISTDTVILLAPSDGGELEFTSVNFNWAPIEDATSYQIQIATPDFASANQIVTDVLVDSLTQLDQVLNQNQYQWRVKALNSGFETPYTTASFTIISNDDFDENTVILLSPEDGLISNQASFSLQWQEITDATSYRLQIIDNTTQGVLDQISLTTNQTDYTFEDGDLSWEVRAEKDDLFTLYSSRSIVIDTQAPNAPNLTAPEDEIVLTDENVSFSWDRELLAGSEEFDSLYLYLDATLETLVLKEQVETSYETILSNAIYYWRMKAFDVAGNESDESEVFSFTVNQ